MLFFFRAWAEKDFARQIDASSVVWILIDNGKLANQIARLAAIVVKNFFEHDNLFFWPLFHSFSFSFNWTIFVVFNFALPHPVWAFDNQFIHVKVKGPAKLSKSFRMLIFACSAISFKPSCSRHWTQFIEDYPKKNKDRKVCLEPDQISCVIGTDKSSIEALHYCKMILKSFNIISNIILQW